MTLKLSKGAELRMAGGIENDHYAVGKERLILSLNDTTFVASKYSLHLFQNIDEDLLTRKLVVNSTKNLDRNFVDLKDHSSITHLALTKNRERMFVVQKSRYTLFVIDDVITAVKEGRHSVAKELFKTKPLPAPCTQFFGSLTHSDQFMFESSGKVFHGVIGTSSKGKTTLEHHSAVNDIRSFCQSHLGNVLVGCDGGTVRLMRPQRSEAYIEIMAFSNPQFGSLNVTRLNRLTNLCYLVEMGMGRMGERTTVRAFRITDETSTGRLEWFNDLNLDGRLRHNYVIWPIFGLPGLSLLTMPRGGLSVIECNSGEAVLSNCDISIQDNAVGVTVHRVKPGLSYMLCLNHDFTITAIKGVLENDDSLLGQQSEAGVGCQVNSKEAVMTSVPGEDKLDKAAFDHFKNTEFAALKALVLKKDATRPE